MNAGLCAPLRRGETWMQNCLSIMDAAKKYNRNPDWSKIKKDIRLSKRQVIRNSISNDIDERDRWMGIRQLKQGYKPRPYIRKNRHGELTQRPYSFVRIDVKSGNPPQFIVRPFVVEYLQGQWCDRQLEEILI